MKILVLGASGATGKQVVLQLCKKQICTRIIVRETAALPEEILNNNLVEIVRGSINEFDNSRIAKILYGCDAVVSCLGHNISLKGILGKPHNLVFNAVKNICHAINKNSDRKIKVVLMSTTAYADDDRKKKMGLKEKIIFGLLKIVLPPHKDNMNAADYLINVIGNNNDRIEWVAVRPDSLINDEKESEYDIYESQIRNPLSDPGKTSRINTAHFMAQLLTNEELWNRWKFKMPVIYNK